MKHVVFFLAVILFISVISCSKDADELILETANLKNDKELAKVRLAFSKIVSIAFENQNFREYFKNNFGTSNGNRYLKECVIALHANDKVLSNGTTLISFLSGICDKEVGDVLGEGFMEEILTIDPLVMIKLPDIFLDFDWDINKMAPYCIAVLPETFAINQDLIAYHFCNDIKKIAAGSIPDFLHVYVKSSDDHIMINPMDGLNPFNQSIFEFLPQIELCDTALTDVYAISKKHEFMQEYIIVDIKEAFNVWHKECGYSSLYTNVQNCNQECQRLCPNATNITVLESFFNNNSIFFDVEQDLKHRESLTLYGQFRIYSKKLFIGAIAVPIRFSALGTRKYTIKSMAKKLSDIPRIQITKTDNHSGLDEIPIKYLIKKDDEIDVVAYDFGIIYYGDTSIPIILNSGFNHEAPIVIHAERTNPLGSNILDYCDYAQTDHESAGCTLRFKY